MNKNTKIVIISTISTISILAISITLGIPWAYLAKAFSSPQPSAQAEEYYKSAIKSAIIPRARATANLELARYYLTEEHNGIKALKHFEEAYKYKKSYKDMTALGMIYTAKGDYEKAINVEKDQNAYTAIAINYIFLKDYTNALKYVNTAIEKNPANCWNYRTRAVIYENLKQRNSALEDYQTAIKYCPFREDEIHKDIENYKTSFKEDYEDLKKSLKL